MEQNGVLHLPPCFKLPKWNKNGVLLTAGDTAVQIYVDFSWGKKNLKRERVISLWFACKIQSRAVEWLGLCRSGLGPWERFASRIGLVNLERMLQVVFFSFFSFLSPSSVYTSTRNIFVVISFYFNLFYLTHSPSACVCASQRKLILLYREVGHLQRRRRRINVQKCKLCQCQSTVNAKQLTNIDQGACQQDTCV